MENKTQIHEFYPEVYPRRVWIVKGGKLEALRERFCKRDNTEICFKGAYEGYVDSVMYKENGSLGELIWFPYASAMPVGHISHEATHAAIDIFDDCGCRIDAENQEPFAYLVGWIAKCINEVKRGKYGKSTK